MSSTAFEKAVAGAIDDTYALNITEWHMRKLSAIIWRAACEEIGDQLFDPAKRQDTILDIIESVKGQAK